MKDILTLVGIVFLMYAVAVTTGFIDASNTTYKQGKTIQQAKLKTGLTLTATDSLLLLTISKLQNQQTSLQTQLDTITSLIVDDAQTVSTQLNITKAERKKRRKERAKIALNYLADLTEKLALEKHAQKEGWKIASDNLPDLLREINKMMETI